MKAPLTHLFPTPNFLTIPSVGLDFSDATLRFVKLNETKDGIIPIDFAQVSIPEGCMQGGRIINNEIFINFLKDVQKKHNIKYVRMAIPESQIYSFTLTLDIEVAKDIHSAIELVLEDNIPLKATEAIFDFQILSSDDKNITVQIAAVSESVSQGYFDAFIAAGMVPISFELDGQAVARAVINPEDKGSYMVVDFGANRTGITIVTNGTAVYTSTLDFGGKMLIDSLVKELNITPDEAQKIKREQGLSPSSQHQKILSTLVSGVSVLKDEINRRYIYWHEKKNQFGVFPTINKIYLCGGHSNLNGLTDYLKNSLKLDVVQVNPWINCLSYERVIPKMPYEISMSYVTAIGLALADYLYD